jgi:CheY-like chemotaxis protein
MKMARIFLAEDNRGDVLLIRRALAEHGIEHELHVVHDGEAAITFLSRMGQPDGVPCVDLVLLDLNLPKVDGSQILRELRTHPQCADTPVIIVSSSNASSDRSRIAALGISHYFQKPSELDAFMRLGAVVRVVLDNQPA